MSVDIGFCGDCYCVPEVGQACPTGVMPPTNFSKTFLSNLRTIRLEEYPSTLKCDPFSDEICDTQPPLEAGGVCAVEIIMPQVGVTCPQDYSYRLVTMSSREEAEKNLLRVTHEGACGVCSTFQDLAVYMENPDLATIGINCANQTLNGVMECFQAAGFTDSCATLWTYDAVQRNESCGTPCADHALSNRPNFGDPPACELVDCLVCEEDLVGPTFKEFGGRTHRSSGLLSALVRPCSDIVSLTHVDPCETDAAEAACKEAEVFEEAFGFEDFGTICQCTRNEGKVRLDCDDTTCNGCSDNLEVCAEFSFAETYSEDGEIDTSFFSVKYIRGLEKRLDYEEEGDVCSVNVDGVACDQCSFVTCADDIEGIELNCSNVPGGANFSVCDLNFTTDGVFQFFNFDEFDECVLPSQLVCLEKRDAQPESFECSCSPTESDVPGRFELDCDRDENCYSNSEGEVDICVNFASSEGYDPPSGSLALIQNVAKYTKGRNDEVRLELLACDSGDGDCPFDFTCSIIVNGVAECDSCELCSPFPEGSAEGAAEDTAEGALKVVNFDCSNVEVDAVYDLCADTPIVISDGIFRFLSDDVSIPDPQPSCSALHVVCSAGTDCCSGRCIASRGSVLKQCRTSQKADKSGLKLSDGRGGAASGIGNRRRMRGM